MSYTIKVMKSALTTITTFIGLPLVSMGSNIAASVDNSEKTTNKLILATALYASSVCGGGRICAFSCLRGIDIHYM